MKVHKKKDCLQIVSIFKGLDDPSLVKISQFVNDSEFKKGSFLYRDQEPDDSLYIVHKGSVKIYRLAENGKEQLVRILKPGNFTGEWTMFNSDNLHTEYAETLRDSTICILKNSDLQSLIAQYPAIGMSMLAEMAKRLDASERQTVQVATEHIDKRLAMYLADLVEGEEDDNIIITLPMARKEIASYLGTTPESISRKFKELETKGLITQLKGKEILIHNVDDLLLYV